MEGPLADMMGHRWILHDLVKKQRKAWLAVADNALGTRKRRNRRGTLVAVQVDDQIVFLLPQSPDEPEQRAEMVVLALLVDKQAFVNIFILLDEIAELLVREQADAGLRIVRAQSAQDRRRQHQIADMHEIDYEDIMIHE